MYYGSSPRGRGGSAKWFLARIYIYGGGGRRRGVLVTLSSTLLNALVSAGYSHRCYVLAYVSRGVMTVYRVDRRVRGVRFERVGGRRVAVIAGKVYFVRKRIRSSAPPSSSDYRPLYSSAMVRLSSSAAAVDALLTAGFSHGAYLGVTLDAETGALTLETLGGAL